MPTKIAYCGLDCTKCPAYIATIENNMDQLIELSKKWSSPEMQFSPGDMKCKGCTQSVQLFSWCSNCEIRNCAMSRNIENCGYCGEYPCDKLTPSHENNPEARKTLDRIHGKL
ncbi:DUF3795 domain-containing protein [Candidatus Harpocratesius sp.]